MKPADLAAAVKARRATPTGTIQCIALSTCFSAVERASSAIGHFFNSQYFTCSIVLNFCTSPSGDMTRERGCPQLISINQISFLRDERHVPDRNFTVLGMRVRFRPIPHSKFSLNVRQEPDSWPTHGHCDQFPDRTRQPDRHQGCGSRRVQARSHGQKRLSSRPRVR